MKAGDIVYFREISGRHLMKGQVRKLTGDAAIITCICMVDRQGHDGRIYAATVGCQKQECFPTIGELVKYLDRKDRAGMEAYLKEIRTVEDLVEFPLRYCINGESYVDTNARKAYVIRAKELTGVILSAQ